MSELLLPGNCIVWEGYKNKKGYGQVWFNNRQQKAHRVAWIKAYGDIPNNLYVCHHCDNPSCVNVDHLFLGTQTDNMRDCVQKGRNKNQNINITHCHKGHEYNIINTYYKNNKRICRVCDRQRKKDK